MCIPFVQFLSVPVTTQKAREPNQVSDQVSDSYRVSQNYPNMEYFS